MASSPVAVVETRQNYDTECEDRVNKQIHHKLSMFYTYLSMSCYFDRPDVRLANFSKYFRETAMKKLDYSQKLMKFQNKRGGNIILFTVDKPESDEWPDGPLTAMTNALSIEQQSYASMLDLCKLASQHKDFEMLSYLENEFLHAQVEYVKELSGHVSNLKRVASGHGQYHFDAKSLD